MADFKDSHSQAVCSISNKDQSISPSKNLDATQLDKDKAVLSVKQVNDSQIEMKKATRIKISSIFHESFANMPKWMNITVILIETLVLTVLLWKAIEDLSGCPARCGLLRINLTQC